jgi:hypothetical protein
MTAIHRAVATLRIIGSDLEPERITAILGGEPTRAERKGQEIVSADGKRTRLARFGHWRREAEATQPSDINAQVKQLLNGLTKDLSVWHSLTKQFKVDIFCSWFMNESNEGEDINPETLLLLGERGISLGLDIYAPDQDA